MAVIDAPDIKKVRIKSVKYVIGKTALAHL